MKKESGAILAVSLLLLLVITLLGVSVIQVTQIEEKMSANYQDKLLSFGAAETGIRAGEAWIISQTSEPRIYTTCPSQPCVKQSDASIDSSTQAQSWWAANAAQYSSNIADVSARPYYLIEFMQFIPDSPVTGSSSVKSTGTYYYTITSYATGATSATVTVIQSTVVRRY